MPLNCKYANLYSNYQIHWNQFDKKWMQSKFQLLIYLEMLIVIYSRSIKVKIMSLDKNFYITNWSFLIK
jgi:hypothetical protein